jgi:hypothetical protein
MRWTSVAAVLAAVAVGGCSRDTSVPAPRPLGLSPATSTIAPRQQLTFAATGGASGYRYALSGTPGSGVDATIDPSTGAYRAGSSGPGTDVVQVTDQGGSKAIATVTVGAMLTIAPSIGLTAPGGKITFTADGGLPPYAFRFQPKGNRSAGHVDGVTGEYSAGPNANTQDKVEVTDAAGAVARPDLPVYVGSYHLPLPGGASELELADLNGDGRLDLVALEPITGSGTRRATTAMVLPGGGIAGETYFLDSPTGISALDLTGDGRGEVFATGSPTVTLLPDLSGHLDGGPSLPASSEARLPFVYSATAAFGSCPGGIGIYREAWNAGTSTFDPTCVTSIPSSKYYFVGDLAVGDFDASGSTDVAWLERDFTYPAPPYPTGTPQLHYVTATPRTLVVPAGYSALLAANAGTRQQLVAGAFRGQGAGDDVVVLLSSTATGRNYLAVAPSFTTGTGPSWSATTLDPDPSGPPVLGIARCPAVPGSASETLVAWNGTLKADPVVVSATGTPSLSSGTAPAVHVPITVAACGDVNGDGVPDLVLASDSTSLLAIVWGDGDGGFGRRPHFQASGLFTMAQVDGDGIGDVVLATDAPSLVTLFGDEDELATGPETPLGFAVAGIWAGDLGGSTVPGWAGDLVLADTSSNLWVAMGTPFGTFARPFLAVPAPPTTGRVPRVVSAQFAKVGGTAPSQDVVVLYETVAPQSTPGGNVPGTYQLDAFVRDATGSPQVITTTLTSTQGADFQAVDLDHDGIDEIVFSQSNYPGVGSPPRWRPVRLKIDRTGAGRFTNIGPLPDWSTLPTATPDPVALGRSADGVAVFGTGFTLDLVWDAATAPTTLPGAVYAPGPTWNGNVRLPARAALGAVLLPHGEPDLVLPGTDGAIYVLSGFASGGRLGGFSVATSALAPGSVAGLLPQGVAQRANVLVFTGEELLPLTWTALGVLK